MRAQLPVGTVTFCFTDVEGSTALLKELGPERYAEALLEHRHLVRGVFARHGGVEVDTQGDAFFYVFVEPGEALLGCVEVQEALAAGPIRLRIGLHTGTAHLTSDGYVGEDMHLGARIAASGHGGQVLLSAATRALADGEVISLGEHRLKDFAERVEIFQHGQSRFPPLKTISNTNLPRPASVFVGRERQTRELVSLLSESARLVTLTGAGGSGKTRLAIEVASELVPAFQAGVFWIGLATLRDPALVIDTIAETLGSTVALRDHIGNRELLLVIDNVEQVVAAAPQFASLLEDCPNLKMLVTSREVLRVRGEVEYAVPPLETSEAVTLFCQRSQLDPDMTIASLCQRLDNLPLAVELASARTSVLSPSQILERLSRRLDLLKGGRDADVRQQTLRAAFEWSHDLLLPEEQLLFRRLSVFAGGCTLEAAEAVADADVDALQGLADKSLLRFADERFWMLESIRQYAAERLNAAGESGEFNRRHADYFIALAANAEPSILGLNPKTWLDRLEIEHDNIRAALDYLEAAGETQLALALGGSIWEFWCLRGHYAEGWRRLERLLNADADATHARAKALTGATHLAGNAGATDEAERRRAEEALALHQAHGDRWGVAYGQWQLSTIAARAGDFDDASQLAAESAGVLRELEDEHHALQATEHLGYCELQVRGMKAAKPIYEDVLTRARIAGDTQSEARALTRFAFWASDEGRHEEALELMQQVYRLDATLGDPNELVMDLVSIARAIAAAGYHEAAVRMLTAAEALRVELGFPFPSSVVEVRDEVHASARSALDPAAFAEAQNQGQQWSSNDAPAILDAVLADLRASSP
jgi:predicted ATPase